METTVSLILEQFLVAIFIWEIRRRKLTQQNRALFLSIFRGKLSYKIVGLFVNILEINKLFIQTACNGLNIFVFSLFRHDCEVK